MKIQLVSNSGINSTAFGYEYIRTRTFIVTNSYGQKSTEFTRKIFTKISPASMQRFYNYTRKVNGYSTMDNHSYKTINFPKYYRMNGLYK